MAVQITEVFHHPKYPKMDIYETKIKDCPTQVIGGEPIIHPKVIEGIKLDICINSVADDVMIHPIL